MISISTTTANTSGNVIIKNYKSSDLNNASARVTRTATLDGGAVIIHSGFSHGDRTLRIDARIDKTNGDNLWSLYKNETFFLVSFKDGLFLAAIGSLNVDNGRADMSILINNSEV